MGMEHRPQAGRPAVSAQEAARVLRKDVRTVRRMIEDGDLAGGATTGAKQRRWYVYTDQLTPTAPSASVRPDDTGHRDAVIGALRAENLELRVQLASANEANQLLLAAQSAVLDAVELYRQAATEKAVAADGYREAADGYRRSAEHYQRSTDGFQSSAESLLGVVGTYRDAVSQFTTPGHLGDLT